MTAYTTAEQETFALGKHNWTISGDVYQCSGGKPYSRQLKLTGCRDEEFTCNNGQCIKMEERCNQLPNCKDVTDEKDCMGLFSRKATTRGFRLLELQEGRSKACCQSKSGSL